MKRKLVHLCSAVNAANVSKAGSTYTIREVCGAVDDIVLNGMLYPADQLASSAATLEGKPAPAGHPKNSAGQHISAVNGEALAAAWIGSYLRNARHEGGRTLVDVVVNESQARAATAGAKLVERLDAAIAGTNTEPIHVSTGLYCEVINAGGESRGKKYGRIATNIAYDHLAILLDENGAGTPEDGVGMFLNAAGQPEAVEEVTVNVDPEDRRSAGLVAWVKRLVTHGGSYDLSFDQITSGLYALMAEGCWIREVFDRYAIWCDRDGRMWRQDYAVSSGGSVSFSSEPVEVHRKVEYETVTNRKDEDSMKTPIVAALNAAGIKTDGLDDAQLLSAYNSLVAKPVEDRLTAANTKIAEHEAAAHAAADAELATLATELAVNSSLKADDFKAMGLARCKELKASAKAAPIVVGNSGGQPANPYADHDPNKFLNLTEAK
jgi:hypothetical protein